MQVAGSGIQVSNTVTPYSPPPRATVSFASAQDLESTLPPVQPLEISSGSSRTGTTPVIVYNRFAQLSETARNPSSEPSAAAPQESVNPVSSSVSTVADDSADPQAVGVSVGSGQSVTPITEPDQRQSTSDSAPVESGSDSSPDNGPSLSEQELEVVAELASRDREVRSHELAHLSVGGQYASAPSFSYERGPDGRSYAVGGEVSIDAGSVQGNPEATINKLEQVRRAALAPAEPSPQDRAVAALASQGILQARAELAQQKQEEATRAENAREQSSQSQEITTPVRASRERENQAIQTYQELIGLGEQLSDSNTQTSQLSEFI